MNISALFANFADTMISRYRNLTQRVQYDPKETSDIQFKSAPQQEQATQAESTYAPKDSYTPSPEAQAQSQNNLAAQDSELAGTDSNKPSANTAEENNSPVEQNPNGTYIKRKASLDYNLKLEFNLGAVAQTVADIAEGDTRSLQEMFDAGFGLKADFWIEGTELTKVAIEGDGNSVEKSRALQASKQARSFLAQTRDLEVASFYREASRIRQDLHTSVHDNHRRTINRFGVRFRMDSSFSMSFANRVNVQTEQVAAKAPESIEGYLKSAGDLAEMGTSELMGTFFDAVDSYLDDAEGNLMDKVTAFFDMAAEQLGFDDATAQVARDHLTDSIGSFFDRIESEVDQMQSKFLGSTEPQDSLPAETGVAQTDDSYELAVA